MQFQLSCAAIVASLAVPAAAQQANPGGSIPIYDITPQVVPTPVPTSTPSATPTPRVTPTPTPAPRPTATPTPPAPRPRVTPSPTSTPSPVALPTAAPAPAPAPAATYVGPQVLPTPEPTATPEPTVGPAPTPTLEAAPVQTGDALPWWLWFLGGIVVATGVALLFARHRRNQAAVVEDIAPVAPVPVLPPEPVTPPPPPRPVARPEPVTPPPAPVAPTPGPFLEFQLAPLRVAVEGDRILLDFDLTVGNPSETPVPEVRIATMLLTAHAEQDEAIATFLANDGKRGLDPFALGAGERRHLEATMTLPRVAVNIVTAKDRPFFVPMIAIDARYRWEDGRESRTTAAFMVGPTAPQGKLAPIFTDRGDRVTDRLEVRLYGQVRRT